MIKVFKYLLCLPLLFGFSQVYAKDKSNPKIHTKCYVELYGGQKTIIYQIVKEQSFNQVAKRLTNRKVMTTLSDEKQKVYKVLECTDYNQTFSNSFANSTEKVTAQ